MRCIFDTDNAVPLIVESAIVEIGVITIECPGKYFCEHFDGVTCEEVNELGVLDSELSQSGVACRELRLKLINLGGEADHFFYCFWVFFAVIQLFLMFVNFEHACMPPDPGRRRRGRRHLCKETVMPGD